MPHPRREPTMMNRIPVAFAGILAILASPIARAADADLIVHHGKVVTVDKAFSVRQALAVKDGKVLAVGTDDEVLRHRGPRTEVIDLGGKTVLPGLMDSHGHP